LSSHALGLGVLLATGCAGLPLVAERPEPAFQRGVALGFVDAAAESIEGGAPGSLGRALDETARLGASDVSILVPLYTESIEGRDVRFGTLDDARGGDGTLAGAAPELPAVPVVARDAAGLLRAIRAVRQRGQRAMIFPIVRLRVRRPGEWRGLLAPRDRVAWFAAYRREMEAIAALCEEGGATRLVIGSELVSFEDDAERWRALAAALRRRFHGRLLYSANWDRYQAIDFWDAVDEIGISAYFSLAARGADPDVEALVAAWQPITEALAGFAVRQGRKVVFTEVGFPSVHGAAFWPWNDHQSKTTCAAGEGCEGALDLEAQRRLWSAFVRVFSAREATPFLAGTYVWLWSGAGGLRDRGYTPRGKPAESVIKLWYASDRPRPAPR
jgi:hypothetical protein